MHPHQDRRREKQHCDKNIDYSKCDLEPGTLHLEPLVLLGREMRVLAMRQHPRLDIPADIEEQVAEFVQADESAHPLLAVVGHDDDLALLRAPQRILADILEAEAEHETGPRQHRSY